MNDTYICNRCSAVFTADEAVTETFHHDEDEYGGVEVFLCCPVCGSVDYESSARCCQCGKPIRYGDLRGGYYCDECIADMRTQYHEQLYIDEMIDDFAEWMHERMEKAENNALDYLKRMEGNDAESQE